MRKIVYAETSNWKVKDTRCRWYNYSGDEACDVIANSPYNDIYFIGDSLVRNTFEALLMLLTGDNLRGAWNPYYEHKLDVCTGPQRSYWKECRSRISHSTNELYGNRTICNNYYEAPFRAQFVKMIGKTNIFEETVEKLVGKPGSLIALGAGLHFHCKPSLVIDKYLIPMVSKIRKHWRKANNLTSDQISKETKSKILLEYPQWPKVMFLSTMATGLLKPVIHFSDQNNVKCMQYNEVIKTFCRRNNIEYVDLMQLTDNVSTHDGTHQGYGVNAMKIQFILNYIAANNL